MRELIERLRVLEQDHEPDGWPAVRMRDITALLDALEAAQESACVALVADIRFACGDDGKRMQPELVEFIRGLAEDSARLDWIDEHGAGIRSRANGHKNMAVWNFNVEGEQVKLRQAIDLARGEGKGHG